MDTVSFLNGVIVGFLAEGMFSVLCYAYDFLYIKMKKERRKNEEKENSDKNI